MISLFANIFGVVGKLLPWIREVFAFRRVEQAERDRITAETKTKEAEFKDEKARIVREKPVDHDALLRRLHSLESRNGDS
jgi:hypothetical protein